VLGGRLEVAAAGGALRTSTTLSADSRDEIVDQAAISPDPCTRTLPVDRTRSPS